MKAALICTVASLCLCRNSGGQDAAGPEPAGAKPEPLQLCLSAAADLSPVYPTRVFASSVREVNAVFQLNGAGPFEKLTAVWIARDVGDAAPPNYEIGRVDQPLQGKQRGRFRYSQPNPLPAGKYRLDVLADGSAWTSVDFEVVTDPKAIELKQPAELFPLVQGKSWTYDFMEEAEEGAKAKDSATAPGAGGKLRAKVTFTVAGEEPPGKRIELRRDGALVYEEWWRLEGGGLVATQRGPKGGITRLDPPQTLLSLPLTAYKSWSYEARDGSFRQASQQWGPVSVRGPGGPAQGYVVFTEQAMPPGKTTAERHFVPGVGLVREVIITAIGGEMVNRRELVLLGGGAKAERAPAAPEPEDARPAAAPKFETDFKTGLERAKEEGKPLLVEFYTTRCPYSRRMETTVYPDPAVTEYSSRHVWVRLDQEKGEGSRLMREWNGGATPTYMVVAHDGKSVYYRFSDAVSKDGFLQNLGLVSVSREEYLKASQNPEARLPTVAELLTLAKGALMEGDLDSARRTLDSITKRDAKNESGLLDDALVLWGNVENASWTDDGAKKASALWRRVLDELPSSDRAPDAVFYLAQLLGEVGPKEKAKELAPLLQSYPREVEVDAARKTLGSP